MNSLRSPFFILAFLVTFSVAGVLSAFASSNPDGFETVTEQYKIEESETKAWNHAPMADYAVPSVGNESLSTGLSGVAGTLVVLLLGFSLSHFALKKPGSSVEPTPTQ